ncbi:MAG: DUF805 domain-containing protein [Verrucomicrobiaceae bacterium]|nr:DUF805 domain-containing protein [Verrucomicrobiaceae bacterium]
MIDLNKKYTSLFSFKDRIGRLQFFVSYVLITFISIGLAFYFSESCSPFLYALQIMLTWPILCICVKRGHDCNINAFVSLFIIVVFSLGGALFLIKGSMLWYYVVSFSPVFLFLGLPKVNDNNRFGTKEACLIIVDKSHYIAFSIWSVLVIICSILLLSSYELPELPFSNDKLALKSLILTSSKVECNWVEKDVLKNDSGECFGTCFAVKLDDKYVHFVTNKHVLDLVNLSKSDVDRSIEVALYELKLKMPSGKKVKVSKIRHRNDDLDLVVLLVEKKNIQEGRDYIIVPFNPLIVPKIGDETIAVGTPHGLEGTHTFGRISALRDKSPYIQIDTPINPGNSGGPLFIKRNNKYSLVGVNTWKIKGSQNLNFSIRASLINVGEYVEFAADKYGIANLLSRKYGVKGVAK